MYNVKVSSKDEIRLLTDKNELYSYRKVHRKDSSQNCSYLGDTIHYLSPATSGTNTVCEGDFFRYLDFFPPEPDVLLPPTYPSTTSTSISCIEPNYQRTICLIKPEAMEFKDVVLREIFQSGLDIISQRKVHLTAEQVSEIFSQYYGTYLFPHIILTHSIGPMLVLSIAGLNAIEKWKQLVGPNKILREEWFFPYSVRTRFGLREDYPDVLHASENALDSKNENIYFFPRNILEPIMCDHEKVVDYLTLHINKTLENGLLEVVKAKPLDPVIFLAEWLLKHNPYQPQYPGNIHLAPT